MKLAGAFRDVAFKRLVAVEVDSERSNGHELNTGPGLREFFRDDDGIPVPITWLRLDDDGVESTLDGTVTYYKAHKDPTRNEWRIYYSGEPFRPSDVGDHVLFLRGHEGTVWGIVVAVDGSWRKDVEQLFGIDLEVGEVRRGGASRGFALPQKSLEVRTMSFRSQLLLEELGLEETSAEVAQSDADLVSETFGDADVWPTTRDMAVFARTHAAEYDDADEQLLAWLEREEALFRALERIRITARLEQGFVAGVLVDVDAFISYSLSVQNRRKSRRGHSLEHHLAELFNRRRVRFSAGAYTEGRRKPDFIFPGIDEYHRWDEGDQRLLMLAAKTTCKDRWRQILTEAAKIPNKHLCTLQPGLSDTQLEEMHEEGVTLVIPARDHGTHPERWRSRLWSVEQFIDEAARPQVLG